MESPGVGPPPLGHLRRLAGADPDAAAAHARWPLQWAEQAGGAWSRIYVREGVATSHAQRGEWAEAIEVVDEALAIARDRRIALADVPLLLSIRARALIGQGDVGAGPVLRRRGHSDRRPGRGRAFTRPRPRHQLGRALLAGGEPEAATRGARAGARHRGDLRSDRLRPHSCTSIGRRGARATGDKDAEELALRTAHRLFLEAGAPARAAEALALVGLA